MPTAPKVNPHEWTRSDKHPYTFCKRCSLIRTADRSNDKKECKGPTIIGLRRVWRHEEYRYDKGH